MRGKLLPRHPSPCAAGAMFTGYTPALPSYPPLSPAPQTKGKGGGGAARRFRH